MTTFYESRHWAQVWSQYTRERMQPRPRVVEFDDGINVVVPITDDVRAGGLLRLHRMSPADTYGAWLHEGQLPRTHTGALIRFITRDIGSVRWLADPFLVRAVGLGAFPRAEHHTLVLDLNGGFESCRARWSKGHRSAASQAVRQGVTVRVAESRDDWLAYFGVYQDSLRRWGARTTSRYDWGLFEALAALPKDLVRLWIASADDEVIAGALCFYHPSHVVHWHAAAKERFLPLRPSNLLIYEAVRHACDSGATWFDLGPSGGHVGVERFKLGYGPSLLEVPVVDRSTPVIALARRVRGLARHIRADIRG